jgi:hypothetical protein
MTPPDEQLPHDERMSKLYRRIRQQEPSALLDARIRQQARRELRRHYWPPLAAAAIIVLGITIALRLFDVGNLSPELQAPRQAADTPSSETTADAERGSPLPAAARPAGEVARPATAESALRRFQATQTPKSEQRLAPAPDRVPEPAAGNVPPPASMQETLVPRAAKAKDQAEWEAPCGQTDLRNNPDRQTWQQRIRELRDAGQTKTAECLVEQFAQRFGGD